MWSGRTGFETRAIAGEAPKLPAPVPAADAVAEVIAALRDDRRTVGWDLANRAFVTS